jgi:hypothetical protein
VPLPGSYFELTSFVSYQKVMQFVELTYSLVSSYLGRGSPGGAVDWRGPRPMWIGYSRGRDWRGARPIGLDYSTGSDRRGGRPVGPRSSLSDNAPRADSRRTRSPSTRPLHVPHPPHEGCTEGGGSGEEEGAPGPATTDKAVVFRFLDTCCVHYFYFF